MEGKLCSACQNQPPFQDRNLYVDSIAAGGTLVDLSKATYTNSPCNQNAVLLCTGDMTVWVPNGSPIVVTAHGTVDSGVNPHMQVLLDGAVAGQWEVPPNAQAYSIGGVDAAASAQQTYYLNDHLGTLQMELSGGGVPLWEGTFTPFGQEIVAGNAYTLFGAQPADGTSNTTSSPAKKETQNQASTTSELGTTDQIWEGSCRRMRRWISTRKTLRVGISTATLGTTR